MEKITDYPYLANIANDAKSLLMAIAKEFNLTIVKAMIKPYNYQWHNKTLYVEYTMDFNEVENLFRHKVVDEDETYEEENKDATKRLYNTILNYYNEKEDSANIDWKIIDTSNENISLNISLSLPSSFIEI